MGGGGGQCNRYFVNAQIDLVSNSIVLPLECLHDFHHNQDIVDLFRGEQNVRRQKPEVGKFKPQIGELSGFELITYLSFPSGLKSLRG